MSSSEKQTIEDEDVRLTATKSDEHDGENKSKSNESDIDNDSDDTSSNASSEYEVEKILAKRKRRRGGGFEYYIKWVGYDDSANEWIPEMSLSCPDRVAEFERDEIKKRRDSKKEQYQPSKRRSSLNNNHKQKKQQKRRRMKIIDNDDDDDDDDDNNNNHKPTTKSPSPPPPPSASTEPVKSVESPSSSSAQSDKDSNAHLSITYGVEKGYKVQAILGINRTQGDQLHYLVHYKAPTIFEDNMELIPSNIAKKYCEDEIIQFFETRIAWNERENS